MLNCLNDKGAAINFNFANFYRPQCWHGNGFSEFLCNNNNNIYGSVVINENGR